MSFNASDSSTDAMASDVNPVPAYETNPTPSPETQPAAPVVDDITVYGAVTVQQHSSTTPNSNDQNSTIVSENKYTLQPVSEPASSAPQPMYQLPQQQQQMQQILPQQQQLLQLTPQQQQMLQLTPQQLQMLQLTTQQQQQLPQLIPQHQVQQFTPQQKLQQLTPQQQQMQQLPLQQAQQQWQQQQQQQPQRYQTAVRLANLQEAGAPVDCPVCGVRDLTIVEKVSGSTTHLWAAIWCVFTGFGCIPYLMHGLKDSQHKCGYCGVLLARWHKSGGTVVFQHG